jgi:hypothetical protein
MSVDGALADAVRRKAHRGPFDDEEDFVDVTAPPAAASKRRGGGAFSSIIDQYDDPHRPSSLGGSAGGKPASSSSRMAETPGLGNQVRAALAEHDAAELREQLHDVLLRFQGALQAGIGKPVATLSQASRAHPSHQVSPPTRGGSRLLANDPFASPPRQTVNPVHGLFTPRSGDALVMNDYASDDGDDEFVDVPFGGDVEAVHTGGGQRQQHGGSRAAANGPPTSSLNRSGYGTDGSMNGGRWA